MKKVINNKIKIEEENNIRQIIRKKIKKWLKGMRVKKMGICLKNMDKYLTNDSI
jgi:hypothetical protein